MVDYNIEMWKYARHLKRVSPDSVQGIEHIPNRSGKFMGVNIAINSHGQRDREFSLNKPQGVTRIMMLGDSITLGWGVPYEQTISKHLEKLLNATQSEQLFEVINTGVGNTNSQMQVAYFLNQGIKFSPDIVILNYFINDAEIIQVRKSQSLSEYSYVYNFLVGKLDTLFRRYFSGQRWQEYYQALYAEGAQGWEPAKAAIKSLAEYSRTQGIQLLMVNYPELHNLKEYPFLTVNQKLKVLASDLNIPYLDLLPSVQGSKETELWVSPQDQHPNGNSCALFTEAIRTFLVKTLHLNN